MKKQNRERVVVENCRRVSKLRWLLFQGKNGFDLLPRPGREPIDSPDASLRYRTTV